MIEDLIGKIALSLGAIIVYILMLCLAKVGRRPRA